MSIQILNLMAEGSASRMQVRAKNEIIKPLPTKQFNPSPQIQREEIFIISPNEPKTRPQSLCRNYRHFRSTQSAHCDSREVFIILNIMVIRGLFSFEWCSGTLPLVPFVRHSTFFTSKEAGRWRISGLNWSPCCRTE